MPQNKHLRALLWLAYGAAGALLFFIAMKYLLPWFAPFLLAFLTAASIEPVIRYLIHKFNISHGFASASCSLLVIALICGIVVFAVGRIVYELTGFVRDLPQIMSGVPGLISTFESKIDNYIVSAPPEIQNFLAGAIEKLSVKVMELPATLSGKLLEALSKVAASAPKIVLFAITYAIGVFFISGSFQEIKAFLLRQVPYRHRKNARNMKDGLSNALVKWLKAQVILMCITFLELTVAFLILKIEYAAFLALFISFIDALPVFGVGTIVLPWAVVALLMGNAPRAAALLAIYCIVMVVRNFLQPRLVGGMLGIHQVPMLIAIYIGFCVAGFSGMILLPIGLVMLKRLVDTGYIRLWK